MPEPKWIIDRGGYGIVRNDYTEQPRRFNTKREAVTWAILSGYRDHSAIKEEA